MESNKKWGWSNKNYYRYYRKIYVNNYQTLTKIYSYDFIHDELQYRIFGDFSYRSKMCSLQKKLESRRFRLKQKREIKRIITNNIIDNDSFPRFVKNIAYGFY